MKITRTSMFTKVTRTRAINITPAQLEDWQTGTKIQNAAPQLDADDREFLMTGMTPEEFEQSVGPQNG
tara:strand:- start:1378 stop:1581 length:204 start_codon:yes stop_codon:yes gene_type:complete